MKKSRKYYCVSCDNQYSKPEITKHGIGWLCNTCRDVMVEDVKDQDKNAPQNYRKAIIFLGKKYGCPPIIEYPECQEGCSISDPQKEICWSEFFSNTDMWAEYMEKNYPKQI